MPLAQSVEEFLARRSAAGARNLDDMDVCAARQRFDYYSPLGDIPPRELDFIEELAIDTRDGAKLRARIYYPEQPCWANPVPALLYFHSGGYVVGSLRTADSICRMFAAEADCAVVSVSYRLAPEYKFPCAVNDAIDSLFWLQREAGSLAVDPTRLAVAGESSGATLATICAVHARDAAIPLALQMLIYPALSAGIATDAHRRYGNGYFLSFEIIRWIQQNYLVSTSDCQDWRFAPLDGWRNAPTDYLNLAPAWIASAEYDPLRDEHACYAEKLRSNGNRVSLHFYAGMIHGFFSMGRIIPEATVAHQDAARALREALKHNVGALTNTRHAMTRS